MKPGEGNSLMQSMSKTRQLSMVCVYILGSLHLFNVDGDGDATGRSKCLMLIKLAWITHNAKPPLSGL